MRARRSEPHGAGGALAAHGAERGPSGRAIALAGLGAMLVAALAVWLFAPSPSPIDPVSVAPESVLDAPRLGEARGLAAEGRALSLIGLALQLGLLAALAFGRPRRVSAALGRLAGRPAFGSMLTGAVLWLAISLVTLPTSLIARASSVEAGLSTQSLGSWLRDFAVSTAIWMALAALALGLLAALWRRLGRVWWLAASAGVVVICVLYVWLSPILIGPAFNDYTELPPGDPIRADVERLAGEAGVEVGEIQAVDSSRRTTAINAYVGGLGSTKRVVVYDTLLGEGGRAELRSVLAHELGHVVGDDLVQGLAFIAVLAPFALLFCALLARRLALRRGLVPGSPAALPGLVLGVAIAVTVLGVFGNVLSRQVEASADTYALGLTRDPQALIALQQRFARTNLNDPDPPGLWSFLFDTHPSTVERVGAAIAYEDGARPGG